MHWEQQSFLCCCLSWAGTAFRIPRVPGQLWTWALLTRAGGSPCDTWRVAKPGAICLQPAMEISYLPAPCSGTVLAWSQRSFPYLRGFVVSVLLEHTFPLKVTSLLFWQWVSISVIRINPGILNSWLFHSDVRGGNHQCANLHKSEVPAAYVF